MRPIRVEFQAFGPYEGHEIVDFEEFAVQGLFLICGKTGTGKSMILDAMTFALYGKSSGHGRDDFEAMRCTNAGPDQKTFVKFEFENNGKYYLFERRLEQKKKNLSASYNVMEREEDGSWTTLLENPREKEVNSMAAEIIGLQYDQFNKVIILPQGQFEKLLTSTSDEKEKILTTLFGEEKWQGYADAFFGKASEKRDRLRETKQRIADSLAEEHCAGIVELERLIAEKEESLEGLVKEYQEAGYEKILLEVQESLTLSKRFGDLHLAERKCEDFVLQRQERDDRERRMKDGMRAEKVRELLEAASRAEELLRVRRDAQEKAKVKAQAAGEAARQAALALEQHCLKEGEVEEKKALRIQFAAKRADYEGVDQVEKDLREKREEEKKAKKKELKAKETYEEFGRLTLKAKADYEVINHEHQELLNRYLAGIVGELADGLLEGKECPVCGSTMHPHKAPKAADNVSREAVDQKKEELDRQYQKLNDMTGEQERAKSMYEEAQKAVYALQTEMAGIQAKLESVRQNMVEGISSLGELESAVARIDSEVKEYMDTKAGLESAERAAKEVFTAEKAKIQPAEKETADAQESYFKAVGSVEQGLRENQFATKEEAEGLLLDEGAMERLRTQVADYDAGVKAALEAVEALRTELAGKEEPDEALCRARQQEASLAQSEFAENRGILNAQIQRLKTKASKLKTEGLNIDERLREAEEDYSFAKKLRGDAGTGLQRYVLGIHFSSVIAAANKMLEMIHGGRYRLYRSDEKVQGTNKRGLELKVKDSYSEDHSGRFVNTLSGGEKFLTSLALSIGMSVVAQKSGIHMEALFIDEGFGTLDEDSIGDAMDVLNSIQEAHGLVGIISHVQLLQDRIPMKLRVVASEKGKEGSHIVKAIG